jgi:hypothetical protein
MESWPKLITHDIEMVFLRNPHFIFVPPSQIFVWEGKVYAPQTKILEGRTRDEVHILD